LGAPFRAVLFALPPRRQLLQLELVFQFQHPYLGVASGISIAPNRHPAVSVIKSIILLKINR